MASTFHQISSLLILVLFASQISKAVSRESQFFSKTPSTVNKGVVLTDEDDNVQPQQQQEEPSFLPQNVDAYGISAMKDQLPESFDSEVKQEDLSDSQEFNEEQTFTEDNNNNDQEDANDSFSFSDETEGLRETGFGNPNQVEGMGETRFMNNGYVSEVENFSGNEKLNEYQVNGDSYNDQQLRNAENFNWP